MSKLYHWKQGVELIAAGLSTVRHIVTTGDSGVQGTQGIATSWPSQLADMLNTAGIPCQWRNSTWGVKAAVVSGVATDYDPSLTITGTTSSSRVSFGRQSVVLSSSGATYRKTMTGYTDTVVIAYRQKTTSAGSFNVDAGSGSIGGATSTAGTDGVLAFVTKTYTRANNSVVTATTTSASDVEIQGIYAYDSTVPSFVMHNGGGSQWPTGSNGGGNAYLSDAAYSDVIAALNADVGFYSGGGNDMILGWTAAGCLTNMRVGFAAIPNDRVMLTTAPLRSSGGSGPLAVSLQDQFAHINRTVAWQYDAPIIDTYASYASGWATAYAQGFMLDDYHFSTAGKATVAADCAALLLAA